MFRCSSFRFAKWCLLASVFLFGTVAAQMQVQHPTEVLYPLLHDVSRPLAELAAKAPPPQMPSGPIREIPNREYPYESTPLRQVTDRVLQNYFGTAEVPTTIANFEGINNLAGVYPPDPNGAAGPDHFVQTVNTHFAVWDKSGTQLQAPQLLAVLWNGFPGPWAGRSDGDPVVLYDRYSNRWVIMQFSVQDPYYILFAVSTTSNPLGTYNRYAYQFTAFPDYPKISVWRDGYYMAIASFNPGYIGTAAVAVERDSMLTGGVARMVMFQRGTSDPRLLSSDVDGTLPPPGTPNYFAGVDLTSMSVRAYEMAVNWANPASSTFTDVATLPASPFVAPVCVTRNCLPQPGTAVGLDALSDRLLFRLQYRNFGSYQAMVANHTVKIGTAGVQAGIRWYELRKSGGPWSIYQQGTYAPDADSRWMASIAMDKFGNIGLGYTVTSGTVYPSIRFTGRRAGDPLGQMTLAETTIVAGTGSQTGTAYRWGDYSSMHLDPTDDWTMWYTNEYLQTTGTAPWRTRIASFRLPPSVNAFVRGTITNTSGGTPVADATVDFVESITQIGGTSAANGSYVASARIDSPATTANLTLRARKFGFRDTTLAVTLTSGDSLTRNFAMTPVPSGMLSVFAHTATTNIRAFVEVKLGSLVVVSDSTNATTGLLTATLPAGTYSVRVDPPSPLGTRNFPSVVINAGATTNVDALLRSVLEFSPTAMRDTLSVGGSRAKNLTMTNTTADTVRFRITDDNALARATTRKPGAQPNAVPIMPVEGPKNVAPTVYGNSPNGRGGPDEFGYSWIDSDEPGGPAYNWVEIRGVGTEIAGLGDDTNLGPFPIGFSFPFYGNNYSQIRFCSNGWLSFTSTATTFTNDTLRTTAEPNNAIYPFWDDFVFSSTNGAHAYYYYDAANAQFIVQYDSVPHFGTTEPGTYTFQVILKPNGEMKMQYRQMVGTLNSSTIGIENANGSIALRVAYNAAYVHDGLAIKVFLPDASWLSENPTVGEIPPSGNQNVAVTFDASGLTPNILYNANLFVDATHPDVSRPFTIPASVQVNAAVNPVLSLNKTSITFPPTQINTTRRDTVKARNVGGQPLIISSITSTGARYAVTPASSTLAPGDSLSIVVAYTPTTVGTDTGRVIILSNSDGTPRRDVTLTGTAIGAPSIIVGVTTIADTLQVGQSRTKTFTINNATPAPTTPLFVSITDSATWLNVTPALDTLQGGVTKNYTTAFNATGLAIGTYTTNIRIASNDPASALNIVAATLRVVGGPIISVRPDSLVRTLNSGNSAVDTLVIRNTGVSPLNWIISDLPAVNVDAQTQADVLYPPVYAPDGHILGTAKGETPYYYGPPQTEGAGGPDSAGYRWIDSDEPGGPTFNWIDIRSVGTAVTLTDDQNVSLGALGFTFDFYGTAYDSVRLCSNGWMSFTSTSTALTNAAIPATAEPNTALFGFWDDLNPSTGGTVHYYRDAANRRFIVQFTDVPHFGTTQPGIYTFEIIINADGSILYQYLDMRQTINSASIGIENRSGTVGLQVAFNTAYVHNNLAVLFAKDVSWLSENPISGSVDPNDSVKVAVTFNTAGLLGGTYRGQLQIASNDFANTPKNVPARLSVIGVPGISAPASIPFGTVFVSDSLTKNLIVKNVGTDTLRVGSFAVTAGTVFTMANTSAAIIAPRDSVTRTVKFKPTAAANYNSSIRIISNDPDPADDTVFVALSGTGSNAPVGSVNPSSISITLNPGLVDSSRSFFIRNTGGSPLTWTITELPTSEAPVRVSRQEKLKLELLSNSPSPDMERSATATSQSPDALGDTLFTAPLYTSTNLTNNQGIEYTGTYFWSTNRGPNPSLGSNYMLKFTFNPTTKTFTLIDSVLQASTTEFGYRDLAFDGTFLYGSEGLSLKQINANTGVETGVSINVTGGGTVAVLRALAYDPVGDLFYAADFTSSIIVFNRSGVVTRTIPNPGTPALNLYGLGWDNLSAGGPYLWAYSQDGTPAIKLSQIRVSDGTVVASWQGVGRLSTEIAGGGTVVPNLIPGKLVYLGVNQGASVTAYDIGTAGLPWVDANVLSGSTAPGDSSRVKAIFNTTSTTPGNYTGQFRVTSNDPVNSPHLVSLALTVPGTPTITVTSPNGGETWRQGSTYPVTWTNVLIDTVMIHYSTAGPAGPWNQITGGVPARPTVFIHPKANARQIEGSIIYAPFGTFNWTIPTTVPNSANCFIRVAKRDLSVSDISNTAFTITNAVPPDTSWVVQTSGTTVNLLTAKAVDANIGWAAGEGSTVLRTTNGGTNWTSVGAAPINGDIYAIEARDANNAWITTSPGGGGSGTYIFRTTNGGTTWTQVFSNLGTAAFIDGIQMTSATNGYAMGDPVAAKYMILQTADAGATWARMATEPAQDGAGWNNSFQIRGTTMWFGTNASKVYRSTDLGVTWTSAATTSGNSYAVWFNDANLGMAGFAVGATNRSTNGGAAWTATTTAGTATVGGMAGVSGTEFWATSGTNVFWSSNHGTTWSATAKNGYTGSQTLNHVSMTRADGGDRGWAVGAAGTIVRYNRFTTDVAGNLGVVPTVYALDQNFPNPFNPSTTIRFSLPEQATVRLKIFNLLGQEVAMLVEGNMQAAFHTIVWNGRNTAGTQVASGMYFYRIEATGVSGEKFNNMKKLVLLK